MLLEQDPDSRQEEKFTDLGGILLRKAYSFKTVSSDKIQQEVFARPEKNFG